MTIFSSIKSGFRVFWHLDACTQGGFDGQAPGPFRAGLGWTPLARGTPRGPGGVAGCLARAWTGQWGLEPTNIRLMLERMNIFRPLVFDIAEFSLFFYSHAGRKFWIFGYIVFKKQTGWGRLCGGVNSRGD